MSMIQDSIKAILNGANFFDFAYITGNVCITDYSYLKKELVLSKFEGNECDIKIGKEKEKIRVESIEALKSVLKWLIEEVIAVESANSVFEYTVSPIQSIDGKIDLRSLNNMYSLDFSQIDKEQLTNQLVFDVLFHKYQINNAEKMMTRSGYAKYMSQMLDEDKYSSYDVINKSMERSMEKYYHLLKYSEIGEELKLLGADRNTYAEYYNPQMSYNLTKKKPKPIWDYLFYNHNIRLTYRQYRRQVTKDGRNYSYQEFMDELREYDDFINKLLPMDNESPEKYFVKSMEYYALESYKRIDFIFKIMSIMHKMRINENGKEHFLLKRYCPLVLVPYERDNEIQFGYKYKYYRSLFFIEDLIHKKMQNNYLSHIIYADLLQRYQHVRAKAYEIFNYQYEYDSFDYKEIKDFIHQLYNMKTYHSSNEIWDVVGEKTWKDMDQDMKRKMKLLAQNFFKINEALFWKSPNREIIVP